MPLKRTPVDPRTRNLFRRGSRTFMVTGAGMVVAMGLQLALTRTLGVEGYGLYVVPLNVMAILLLPALVGMDTGAVRFVAEYRATRAWRPLAGFFRLSLVVPFLTAGLLGTSTWLVARFWVHDARMLAVFAGVVALLPATAVLRILGSHLLGLNHAVWSKVPDLLIRPMVFGVLVLVFVASGQHITAPRAVALHVLAVLFAIGVSLFLRHRWRPAELGAGRPEYRHREWIGVSSGLFLLASFRVLMNRTDVLLVGAMMNASNAGIIAIVDRLGTVVALGLTAMNTVVAPQIAGLHSSGQHERLQEVITRSTWWIFLVTVAAAASMILFGREILGWFAPGFTIGYAALVLVCLGQVVNGAAGSVGYLMAMTGNHRLSATVVGTTAGLNALLNVALIPRFGLVGSAAATAFSLIVSNVTLAVLVRRVLHLRSTVLPW